MSVVSSYLFFLFRFWYFEAPVGILRFYKSLTIYCINLLSLPLILQTFFMPLKNEYRVGLVGFSIAMGITLKTILMVIDLFFLFFLVFIELLLFAGFIFYPLIILYIFFL